jgi:hypothetical protein
MKHERATLPRGFLDWIPGEANGELSYSHSDGYRAIWTRSGRDDFVGDLGRFVRDLKSFGDALPETTDSLADAVCSAAFARGEWLSSLDVNAAIADAIREFCDGQVDGSPE